MGPQDPFQDKDRSGDSGNFSGSTGNRANSGIRPATGIQPHVVGLLLGMLFGILVFSFSVLAALAVFAMGAAGALLAWIGHGLTSGRFDVGEAWRVLRGGDFDR